MAFSFLIVDDEQLSRNYIRNMLQRYDVNAAIFDVGSAQEAMLLLDHVPIDVLFLDIKMPEVDGFGLLATLSHRNFELVFITAYNQYAIRAIKEGAADYLLKPIKKADFTDMLERVLARRNSSLETAGKLSAYVSRIKEKNDLIDQLNRELDERTHGQQVGTEKIKMLEQLQNNVILTEDDWSRFKDIFESVHTNFFARLRSKYSGLTQAELRLVALTKLNMTTREMAAMLGISPETIRQTRWRLRKKLDLDDDQSLDQLVHEL